MNTVDKKEIAKRARSAWRQYQTQREFLARRSAGPANAMVPMKLDMADVADPTDNTLWKDVILAGEGLTLSIEAWLNLPVTPGRKNTVVVERAEGAAPADDDFLEIDRREIFAPVEDGTFPLPITVRDAELHPDGAYTLRYRVQSVSAEWATSQPLTFICDTTPPWKDEDPAPIPVPMEITDDYLTDNPHGVVLTLPPYGDWAVGDVVWVWWLATPPDNPDELPASAIRADVTGPSQTVTIPTQAITDAGDGGCYVAYLIIDKATNRSRLSVYTRATVALGPLPDGLQPPQVPQAEKGWIDLDDARAGVVVAIPQFNNWKPTDRIEVTWGGTALPPEAIGSAPGIPFLVQVPTATLKAEYGAAQGEKETSVSYRILRGDMPFGPEQTSVQVDFSVIGPELPDPDWPGPINPALLAPTVFGSDPELPNTLTRADGGLDARLEFLLYPGAQEGDQVTFYWNGVEVTEARHIVEADPIPGEPVSVTIPWSYIAAAGNNPELPVHYRISAVGSPNEQHSLTQRVNADAVTLVPDAVEFLNLNEFGDINCQSLDGDDHAALVRVPDLSAYLVEGDTVDLTWMPIGGNDQVDIVEAQKKETITLGSEYPVKGFVWRVTPYEDHILPIYRYNGGPAEGSARAHYTLEFNGETLTSALAEVYVMIFDGNGSCPF